MSKSDINNPAIDDIMKEWGVTVLPPNQRASWARQTVPGIDDVKATPPANATPSVSHGTQRQLLLIEGRDSSCIEKALAAAGAHVRVVEFPHHDLFAGMSHAEFGALMRMLDNVKPDALWKLYERWNAVRSMFPREVVA